MDRRILIVTDRHDLHADVVADKIVAQGGSFFRLNVEAFPKDYRLTVDMRGGEFDGELIHAPSGERLVLSKVGAVWMRRWGDFGFLSQELNAQEYAFAQAETGHVLQGVLRSLDCYWMSHPAALRQASWKGEQLLRAARMGFSVPPSIISNQPAAVATFRSAMQRDIIFKAMSSPTLEAEKVRPDERITRGLPTTRITDDDELDAVAELPCFFQQHIPKRHEVRATVVGEKVFAARIHSQDDPRTVTDFRDFSADIKYEVEILPEKVEKLCLAFLRSYDLNYGAIDIIITPDGEYVFLENNPTGQFLFVEQLVPELNISAALACRLIEGAKLASEAANCARS